MSALSPGTILDRYRIEAAIGAGSMGDVLRGVDVDLGRTVAIKILSEKHRHNGELRARFVREARAVASIAHQNVVQVFTTGTHDDRPFMAMEFLDGVDLGTSVKQDGAWSSVRAARAVLDAARGLDAAARAGLIHRDVKPSNLVLLSSGKVKVTDFGLVRPVDPGSEPALTALGVVVGTPDYIAPEQARGEAIDERVDIYALGGTLYYLLVGTPPFRTGDPAEDKYLKVVARHLRDPAPDPRARMRSADRELAALTVSMMAKKPVDRPGYAELMEQLSAVVERLEQGEQQMGRDAAGPTTGSGGYVAPTPFVGDGAPAVREVLESAGITPVSAEDEDEDEDEGEDEGAATLVRVPTSAPASIADMPAEDSLGLDFSGSSGRSSKLLIVVTIASALVFLTGLALLLFGPMPDQSAPTGAPGRDAGIHRVDAPNGR